MKKRENYDGATDMGTAPFVAPDTLLPEQYFATFRRENLEPEKALMLAILEDAILCFQKYSGAGKRVHIRLFRDAEAWIVSNEGDWLFSFANICEVLGFDPDFLRKGLLSEKEKTAGKKSTRKVPVKYLALPRGISKRKAA
ncbi:hypothetical protein HYW53_02435 [Candidatus Giovannonibacteria bacterium]|nr:hypothetical protein [Candidatus Giovannonibacteria bacterium]